jgi:hypothetical protein
MPYADDGANTWNAVRCVPIDPDAVDVGEPCTAADGPLSGLDDCPLRAMCYGVDPATGVGTCRAFCTGTESNPTCSDPDELCQLSAVSPLMLCLPSCNPLEPSCGNGEGCYVGVNGLFVCHPDASGEGGAYGDECDGAATCDPGLFCATAGVVPDCVTVSCCSEYCDVSDPMADEACAGFAAGQQCLAAFEESPPDGLESVGLCALPQ